ncbi:hypothetical protein V495_07416 [Pseudogymnoascus sp. VKM F-4514 (FW-929)]|nr:hypothetical protein V495_07416 [Pseudogymnoascus sp. VKM F-4514 (FW-929)]KFY60436.1 hypothetical protein V497_03614 [Pseudogymnoascus sp. VKM F-4516 (FW-969)]
MPPTQAPSAPIPSAPPPGQTILYNVYRIYITQGTGPLHQGIALVPAQLPSQTAGRFYHLTGTIGLGMDYQCRPAEKFGINPAFESAVWLFQMPKSLLADFEAIASSVPPPHDPRVLMERNPDPPARDCVNQQLLISALIDARADPNSYPHGNTPLIITVACNSNLTGALKTLLEKGADPSKTNGSGLSAPHVLTEPVEVRQMGGGPSVINETAIHLLLQYKASVSQPNSAGEFPIHWASYGFSLRLFHVYLYSHPEPDQDNLLCSTNNNGETLLHFAAAGCRTEVMEYLPSKGLDVNAANSNGWTPLMCALTPIDRSTCWTTNIKTLANAIESARLLLSYGADPDIVTDEGWAPLHVLALYLDVAGKAEEFAKDLISRGVDPEARALLLSPPSIVPRLYYVCWSLPWGYRLRDVMADPPVEKWIVRSNMMPLHWAAERGAVGVIKALLSSGVDVPAMDVDGTLVDVDGTSPAKIAAESMFLKKRTESVDNIINLIVGASRT